MPERSHLPNSAKPGSTTSRVYRKSQFVSVSRIVVPLLVLYLILAFYGIGNQSLWQDEVHSLHDARYSVSHLLWWKAQGPFYFVLLHFWKEWGSSESFLRLLSVFFGMGCVVLTYLLSLTLFGKRVAFLATILMATSPFLIWYSHEVRYIIVAITTSLLCTLLLVHALHEKTAKWWGAYLASTLLALFSASPAIFLPAAHGIFLIASRSPSQQLKRWMVCQAVVLAVFVAWSSKFLPHNLLAEFNETTVSQEQAGSGQQIASRSAGGPPLEPPHGTQPQFQTGVRRENTIWAIPYTFCVFSCGYSIGPSVRELHASQSLSAALPYADILLPLTLFFGFSFFYGAYQLYLARRDLFYLLLSWLLIPIGGVFVLAELTGIVYNVRYVAIGFPAYLIILAVAFHSFRPRGMTLTALVLVLATGSLSLYNYHRNPEYAREDSRAAARVVQAQVQPDDLVLVVGNATVLDYYWNERLEHQNWSQEANRDFAEVERRVREMGRRHDRIWLIVTRPWETDPYGNVKSALDRSFPLMSTRHFAGIEVYSYHTQAGEIGN